MYADRDLADVPPLELAPRGSTALLDALGRLIIDAGERLAALPEDQRPGSVIVGVMTDGMENASREWTHPRIKELIEQQTRDYGWQFLYLGADQDAIEEGAKMGFAAGKSMTYSRGKAKESIAAMSAQRRRATAAPWRPAPRRWRPSTSRTSTTPSARTRRESAPSRPRSRGRRRTSRRTARGTTTPATGRRGRSRPPPRRGRRAPGETIRPSTRVAIDSMKRASPGSSPSRKNVTCAPSRAALSSSRTA